MGNFAAAKTEIINYIRARTPLIILESSERERGEQILRDIAKDLSINICYYTDAKQVCNFKGNSVIDADHDPLSYIASAFKKKRGTIFAIGDIKRIGDDNAFSREVLNVLYLAKEFSCTLIFITADFVWPRIAQFGMLTTLSYPDIEERRKYIIQFLSAYKSRFPIEWDGDDIRRAAALLRGFSEIQIENILSTTLIANQGLFKMYLYELTRQKSRLYSANACVQMVHVSRNLQVAGLDRLKAWLREKQKVFFATDEALKKRDLQVPKGILLTGVPGCGKSFSAKMIAMEWGLPLFRFDLGTIYDKWVGESEKRMKEALQFIDNVSPCVLWIDEIEKALSVSDTGNDTGKRVLGQFLFWLQESGSRVFLVATANDISLLPFELFRKGRFSEIFFIDLPNQEERRAALAQYIGRSLDFIPEKAGMETLTALSEGFSYSDIEYAVKDVAETALINPDCVINQNVLEEKFKTIVPILQTNPAMVERIRKWGHSRAVAASNVLGGKTEL